MKRRGRIDPWARWRLREGQAIANDPQPWRCATCGEAVSHIRRNDCACIRAARRAAATEGAS